MMHIFKMMLFAFLLTAYTQTNASLSFCDVLAASDGSQKEEGDKKTDGKKKTGDDEEEEEEPDCD